MGERAQVQAMDSLVWRVADMLALPFDDGAFDVVLEKGTMDVLFVDSASAWDPQPAVKQHVFQMLDETHRRAIRWSICNLCGCLLGLLCKCQPLCAVWGLRVVLKSASYVPAGCSADAASSFP